MSGESTCIRVGRRMTIEEIQALYEGERLKAASIHPVLLFREISTNTFEIKFHPKHRFRKGIDESKAIVRLAIRQRYPDCNIA